MSAKRGLAVSAERESDGERDALPGTIKQGDSSRFAPEDIDFLASVEAARRSYAHMEARFKADDVALAELLTGERALRNAEDAADTSTTIDPGVVFEALGGGWDAHLSAADASGSAAHKQERLVKDQGHIGA